MGRNSIRGKGSNQYADKAPASIADTEAQNARVRKMKNFTEVHSPQRKEPQSPLGDDLRNTPTATLTTNLSASLDAQFKASSEEELVKSTIATSAYEDAILTRHNNPYGIAVTDGVYFMKEAKHSPQVKSALNEDGSPERALLDGYGRLLRDATDPESEKLPLEELPEILDRLKGASIARERGEKWRDERSGEPTLSSRFAATSVHSSRDPENNMLQHQLKDLRNRLHERGVRKIDI